MLFVLYFLVLVRCKSQKEEDKDKRDPSLNMQSDDLATQQPKGVWRGLAEVPCTRLDKGTPSSPPSPPSLSLCPSSAIAPPSPCIANPLSSTRAVSVPVIPFVRGWVSAGAGELFAGEVISEAEPSGTVPLQTDPGSADCPATTSATELGPVPETLLGSAAAGAASHGHLHHHHHNHHHHPHAIAGGPSGGVLGSGVTAKHKSLVTYTTALGSGTGVAHVSTVISVASSPLSAAAVVLGPGGAPNTPQQQQQQQYSARLQPAVPRRHGLPARLQASPHGAGDKRASQGSRSGGPRDSSTVQRAPFVPTKPRDGATPAAFSS